MNLLKFVAFLFYRYYSEGKWASSIPFFRTLTSMTLLVYIHLLQLLIIFNRVDLLPLKSSDSIMLKKFTMFLIFLPIYFILSAFIKKDELIEIKNEYEYKWDKVYDANVRLILYIILSMATLIILIIFKAKK